MHNLQFRLYANNANQQQVLVHIPAAGHELNKPYLVYSMPGRSANIILCHIWTGTLSSRSRVIVLLLSGEENHH